MILKCIAAMLALLLLGGCAAAPSTPAEPDVTPTVREDAPVVSVDPSPALPDTVTPDAEAAAAALTEFGVQLLQQTAQPGENCLLSPLSACLALSMAANGANGQTLAQMEAVLGMDIASLNGAAKTWMQDDDVLHLANAVWFRDDPSLHIHDAYLRRCTEVYQADARQTAFDADALKEINRWVSDKTDGMIPTLLSELPDELALLLVNALCFDAKWEVPYHPYDLFDRVFTTESGVEQSVQMMNSAEGLYLDDGSAIGFIKPYAGGKYGFAALLPNEGTAVADYLAGLTGDSLRQTLTHAQQTDVDAALPAFTAETTAPLNESLKAMGMVDAFDPMTADLSGMADADLYISMVLQKTHIEVDAQGTKAAAATAIATECTAAIEEEPPKVVYLDRPFVYLLVDMETMMPLFIGTMMDMG